jgi:hypothetical protein
MMANIARVFLASVALGGLCLTTDAFARGGAAMTMKSMRRRTSGSRASGGGRLVVKAVSYEPVSVLQIFASRELLTSR